MSRTWVYGHWWAKNLDKYVSLATSMWMGLGFDPPRSRLESSSILLLGVWLDPIHMEAFKNVACLSLVRAFSFLLVSLEEWWVHTSALMGWKSPLESRYKMHVGVIRSLFWSGHVYIIKHALLITIIRGDSIFNCSLCMFHHRFDNEIKIWRRKFDQYKKNRERENRTK